MLKRSILLGAALSAAIAVVPAYAQDSDGFYGSVQGGFAFAPDLKVTDRDNATRGLRVENKSGYNFGGAVGYKYNDFRVEGQLAYLRNKVDKLTNGSTADTAENGKTTATTFMANGYYDVALDQAPQFTPYVGLGVGIARVKSTVRGNNLTVDALTGTKSAFAYQGIVGVGYDFADNMRAGVEYRYISTSKKNRDYGRTTTTNNPGKVRYSNNLLNANLTYFFS